MSVVRKKFTLMTLLGDRFELSVVDALALLRNRKTAIFIGLALTVLITADSPGLEVQLSLGMLIVIWPLALAVYLSMCIAILTLVAAVTTRWPALVWPLPISCVLGVIPAAAVCEIGIWAAMGTEFQSGLWHRTLLFIPSVLVFETVYYRFVMPGILWPHRGDAPAETPHPPPEHANDAPVMDDGDVQARQILIGTQKVDVARVRHIEAREHHVRVTLDGATLTQRARLSDIVAQTQPEDGLQPHRSWWVSRNTCLRIEKDGARHVLTLADETRIPVARTRLSDVQDWVDQYVDPGDQDKTAKTGR